MNSSSNDTSFTPAGDTWNPCVSTSVGLQTFFAVEAINFIVGLPVNMWLVWPFISSLSLQPAEVFTLNGAILECVYSSLSFLRPLNYYVIKSAFLYRFNLFFYGLLTAGRPLLQFCICLERYMGVVHPIIYHNFNVLQVRVCVVAVAWVATATFCCCHVLNLLIPFSCLFLVLLILQAFCCVRTLQVLHRPGPGEGSREASSPAKRTACITVLVIQAMLVFNYLPVVLAVPFRGLLSSYAYKCQLLPATLSFSVCGSFVHPLPALLRAARLRRRAARS